MSFRETTAGAVRGHSAEDVIMAQKTAYAAGYSPAGIGPNNAPTGYGLVQQLATLIERASVLERAAGALADTIVGATLNEASTNLRDGMGAPTNGLLSDLEAGLFTAHDRLSALERHLDRLGRAFI